MSAMNGDSLARDVSISVLVYVSKAIPARTWLEACSVRKRKGSSDSQHMKTYLISDYKPYIASKCRVN